MIIHLAETRDGEAREGAGDVRRGRYNSSQVEEKEIKRLRYIVMYGTESL